MHVLREILRQKLVLGLTNRRVASAVGVSAGKVHSVYSDARSLGIDAAAVEAMTDAELTARLYPKTSPACVRRGPDCAQLHLELRRRAVTLALLHVEYLAEQPQGLRYSAFCERYREWLKRHSPVMRQVHLAGDKLFVDYAGMKPRLLDPLTGEFIEVELFVAVLGASNYTYAEATRTQQVTDFTSSVARALTFIGGVPCAIVPDQLKSAIVKACRYDPGVQRTTAELGRYYNTTILPARPVSPRDKAKVEVGVQIAERWLLARIRNETFTSLGDLNRRLFELTEIINTRPMRAYKASRRELFERLDKPALGPLPAEPFQASSWKEVRLNIDYTSTSSITSTRRHMRCSDKSFGSEQRRARSRFFTSAPVSPVTCAATFEAVARPRPSTCRVRIALTQNGRRLASSVGQRPWVKTHALSVM